MTARPLNEIDWRDYAGLPQEDRQCVDPSLLVDLHSYRMADRMAAGRQDPIRMVVAYGQEEMVFVPSATGGWRMQAAPDEAAYRRTPPDKRVNKFGMAYRADAPFLLHRALADIVVDAAIDLRDRRGWHSVFFDGLRTVEAAFLLWRLSDPQWLADGLLARPGASAHNKGMAVDWMMTDAATGDEIDMGGHFDHSDMESNHRLYAGPKISAAARKHRLIREQAVQRAALGRGILIAPLRNEFWDDRFPENREDLWRVLESVARCLGVALLSAEDEAMRVQDRSAFAAKWEDWDYDRFVREWQATFKGREQDLQAMLGAAEPPSEQGVVYHGAYAPLYDRALRAHGKHLANEALFTRLTSLS